MHPSFEAFLAHLEAIQKSPRTVERYRDVLRDLETFANSPDPKELVPDTLLRFASAMRKDGIPRSPAGVNLRVAVLKATFSFLVDRDLVGKNAAARLVGIRIPRRTPKYLTTAEVSRLVLHVAHRQGVNHARDLTMLVLFWQTGLRVSEVARLTWGQLEAERKALSGVLVKGGHLFDVLLNDESLDLLLAYRMRRGTIQSHDAVFSRYDGRALSVRAIESLFQTWRAELGWTRALHPHVLRHTYGTGALALGADIATVAELLRHNGLGSVMIYAAVQDGARRVALARLGALVPRGILGRIASNDTNTNNAEKSTCAESPFYEAGDAA